MITTSLIANICAGGLLLSTFLMISKVRLVPMIRYYILAAVCLAGLGVSVTVADGLMERLIAPLATLLFKAIIIPAIVIHTARRLPIANQLRMSIRPAGTSLLFLLVLALSAFIVRGLPETLGLMLFTNAISREVLFISVALILTGAMFLVIRQDLFSQIFGLLTIENGIASFGLVALESTPIIMELGIFLIIAGSIVVMAVLTDQVHAEYETVDTRKLKELTD
jgi:hydrogenase-4 component E